MFFIMNSWIFQTPAGIPRIAKNSLSGNANIQIYQWLLIYGQPKKTVKLQLNGLGAHTGLYHWDSGPGTPFA
jgi:hypothetical protein